MMPTDQNNPEVNRRILVVDDESLICELIQVRFREHGVEVVCAYDGHTALALYHLSLLNLDALSDDMREIFAELLSRTRLDKPFDVILMDMALPGLNGATVIGKIRNLEKQSTQIKKRVWIIGFSAYDQRMKETKLDQLVDFDDYIAKPDGKQELIGKLEKALGIT